MPLPDTATGLDWSNLVDAARAFEGNRKTSELDACFKDKQAFYFLYFVYAHYE